MSSSKFVNKSGPFTLSELATLSGAKIFGDDLDSRSFLVQDLASLSEATATDLSVLHQKKYVKTLGDSLAGACIIAPEYTHYAPPCMRLLVHKNPYKAYALIAQAFYPAEKHGPYIAETAHVSNNVILGEDCRIEHGAYVGSDVTIGDRCKIGVNTYIGSGVTIGNDCHIENNVSISNTIMGNHVLIYPGARIGQDGFGFASDAQGHYKIPHRGIVLIGHNVAIGANTCIDRGSLNNTVIEDWVRIDNLVQVGHNSKIGKGSVIAGQVGLAGSSELGEFVLLAGQVGVAAHSKIGKGAIIMAQAGVMKDVEAGTSVGGCPAIPIRDWHRQTVLLHRIVKKSVKDR